MGKFANPMGSPMGGQMDNKMYIKNMRNSQKMGNLGQPNFGQGMQLGQNGFAPMGNQQMPQGQFMKGNIDMQPQQMPLAQNPMYTPPGQLAMNPMAQQPQGLSQLPPQNQMFQQQRFNRRGYM